MSRSPFRSSCQATYRVPVGLRAIRGTPAQEPVESPSTRTLGSVHVSPPSDDLENQMSQSPFRSSCHVAYTVPSGPTTRLGLVACAGAMSGLTRMLGENGRSALAAGPARDASSAIATYPVHTTRAPRNLKVLLRRPRIRFG